MRGRELAHHEIHGIHRDAFEGRLVEHVGGVEVELREQRVVVEHLLEVRHRPAGVGHVAEEPPADLVAKPQRRHRPEREAQESRERVDRLSSLRVEEQRELRGGWKLLLLAEPAREPVGHLRGLLRERIAQRAHAGGVHGFRRGPATGAFEHVGDSARRRRERVAVDLPSAHDLLEQPLEVCGGQVGEPEQRDPVRGEHDVERPAGVAQRGLHEPQELRVERRIELAIDLHGDEVRVELCRRIAVGEALALHHVAPVAGEVADGDEDQPVLGAGLRDELRAPLLPVHRIARVQPQVGRCGVREGIDRFVCAEPDPRDDTRCERQGNSADSGDLPEHARSHRDALLAATWPPDRNLPRPQTIPTDQNLEYQQNLRELPLAVIVPIARNNTFETLRSLIPDVLHRLAHRCSVKPPCSLVGRVSRRRNPTSDSTSSVAPCRITLR